MGTNNNNNNNIHVHVSVPSLYVTGFGKTCIVHTSDFVYLEIHKNYKVWNTDLKLSGVIKE